MELSRKEEYRNKKISVGVTAFAFLVMIAFLIFKNIITSSPSIVSSTTTEMAIGISNENSSDPTQGQKSDLIASNTREEKSESKIVTDPNSETPVESSAIALANKYKRIKISTSHETTNTESILPLTEGQSGTETKTGADTKLGYDLEQRSMVTSPSFDNDTKEEGKVIVEIIVDKDGNVTEANPNGRGTSTSSSLLKVKAKKMAMATKFSSDHKREEQRGSITIIFSFN